MIRTLSSALSSSTTKEKQKSPLLGRLTMNSLTNRLSNSTKHFVARIPQHQKDFENFRKRAQNLFTSNVEEKIDLNSNSLDNSSEIVSVDEIYRRFTRETSPGSSFDPRGIQGPTLLQISSLIDEEKSKKLLIELPPRIQELNWLLEFSTEINGFSLNQLYRRSFERDRDDPSLLIIRDVEGNIFGAFVSHQLLISEGFYGNGETFLFTFSPTFRTFHWSGTNEFFVKGDLHSLGIGTGDGKYGLWIDGDLYRGRTCSTKTFENDPLTTKEDFIIANVELWTFVD